MKSVYAMLFGIALLLTSCKVNYSLSGASISPEIKTLTVNYFNKTAALGPPALGQFFTEKLKQKFVSQTSLSPVERGGDVLFEGTITGYTITPQNILPNETAAKNRLSITVNVKYTNKKDEKNSFESSFTRFTDYDSQVNLSTIEDQLVQEVTDQLVDDIFNKAFINW
ncbi:MAG: LptE family protein [Flavobacteriales bacterium]